MTVPPELRMQDLLAEGDFVRSLARRLVGGDDADDVAQDTWLAVLRRRPDGVREPRSWLARTVQRLAQNRRRGDERRTKREQHVAARRAISAPSTDEILACEQVRQRVVAAVLALDEPFRRTVLARFYECLDSDAIARRDGIEVATVRSRLKRALDRLRAQLDAVHGGERAAWAAPLGLLGGGPNLGSGVEGLVMTTTKKFAAGVVALAAGIAVVVAWREWPESARTDTAQTVAANAADPVSQRGSERAADDAANERTSAASADEAWRAPRERLPYPVCDESLEDVTVRVLDGTTWLPVAGAEVVYEPFRVDMSAPANRSDRLLHETVNTDAFLERFGSRVRAGADGCAVVRVPRSGGGVIASQGDCRVRGYLNPGELRADVAATLVLEPSRLVLVRLVDPTTNQAVPGALLEISSTGSMAVVGQDGGYGTIAGPSDADGCVRFQWQPREQTALRVRPWLTASVAWTPLDPSDLARTRDVPCPQTGGMTIELRTPAGHLWPTPIDVYVSNGHGASSSRVGPIIWRSSQPGLYRIPDLQLGSTWKVTAYPEPRDGNAGGDTTVVGPTRAGEEMRVVVQTANEPCRVTASLRRLDGSPVPPVWIARVTQPSAGEWSQRLWSFVGAEGRVTWPAAAGVPAEGRIEILDPSKDHRLVLSATWRMVDPIPGLHELGDIVVGEPTPIVAGTVDAGIAPWRGPSLRVLCETMAADGTWDVLRELEIDPNRDRTFAVVGDAKARRVRVSLLADACVLPMEPVVVDAGTRDVRLVVARGLPLRVRVLAPPDYRQALLCRAVREDGVELPAAASRHSYQAAQPRGDAQLVDFDGGSARYLWPALPDGTYRVEVFAPGVTTPLVTVPGVVVAADAASDPRLDPIDARERTRTLVVTVLPTDRAVVFTDGGVLASPTSDPRAPRHGMLFDERGIARLLVGPDPVDVVVAVPGFALWRANSVTDTSLEVQLAPCREVPFELAPGLAEVCSGWRVRVGLEPEYVAAEHVEVRFLRPGARRDAAMETSLQELARLNAAGTATLQEGHTRGTIPISAPGRFRVRLTLQQGDRSIPVNESWKSWRQSPLLTPEITVGDGATPALVIDVEPAVLAKVREYLASGR